MRSKPRIVILSKPCNILREVQLGLNATLSNPAIMNPVEFSMASSARRWCGIHGVCGVLGAAALLWAATGYAESGPFTDLSGAWTGTGAISLGNGTQERIRCRAQYTVQSNGNGLEQNLRCASDSYRFELRSNLVNHEGEVSGSWREGSRNIGGKLSGSARVGRFQLIVTSPSFSANLSVTAHRDRLSVVISAPPGGQLTGVSITLARAHR